VYYVCFSDASITDQYYYEICYLTFYSIHTLVQMLIIHVLSTCIRCLHFYNLKLLLRIHYLSLSTYVLEDGADVRNDEFILLFATLAQVRTWCDNIV
jgi:hypothetical protein